MRMRIINKITILTAYCQICKHTRIDSFNHVYRSIDGKYPITYYLAYFLWGMIMMQNNTVYISNF